MAFRKAEKEREQREKEWQMIEDKRDQKAFEKLEKRVMNKEYQADELIRERWYIIKTSKS